MRKLIVLTMSACLVVGLAAPALAVEVETRQESTKSGEELVGTNVSIGLGWYIYVKFNRTEVRRIVNNLGGVWAGSSAVAAATCSVIPSTWVRNACRYVVVSAAWSVWNTFSTAARYGQCVQLKFTYPPVPTFAGVARYRC